MRMVYDVYTILDALWLAKYIILRYDTNIKRNM